MELTNKKLEKRFHQVGSQDLMTDPLIVVKFFNPTGPGTWYATEYDPLERTFHGFRFFFGDWNDAWGSFSLDELKSYTDKSGRGIERDINFSEKRASEVIKFILA